VFFKLDKTEDTPWAKLLELYAGTSGADQVDFAKDVEDDSDVNNEDDHAVDLGHDGTSVKVDDELFALLEKEVQTVSNLSKTKKKHDRCYLCPYKNYVGKQSARALGNHIVRHHTKEKNFCPAGSKMLKVIKCLFDNDRCLRRRVTASYLRRAADLMRSTISTPVTSNDLLGFNNSIVLILGASGPYYANKDDVGVLIKARRIGYLYYTLEFANMFIREALLHNGRVKTLRARLVFKAQEVGHGLGHLYPRKVQTWLGIMEDIFWSPYVSKMRTDLVSECIRRDELRYISLDGTLRVVRKVKGQADYRASKRVRAEALFDDSVAKRRILTVRGLTSSVLAMQPIRSEKSVDIARLLSQEFTEDARLKVICVSSDIASFELYSNLKQVLPNFQYLCLDPVHTAIVYETAHYRKKTHGSKFLRLILSKLNKVDYSVPIESWGPCYTGSDHLVETRAETTARDKVLDESMPMVTAQRIHDNLDATVPFYTVIEFIQAIASLVVLYSKEVKRTTHINRKSLKQVLHSMTALPRMHFLFNHMRSRRALPRDKLGLLGSGTCSNEALHSELNRWMKNQPELYITTVEVQLRVIHIAKLLTHNAALYAPTLRQLRQEEVLAKTLMSVEWPAIEWQDFCNAQACNTYVEAASVPLLATRKRTTLALKARAVLKRPSAKRVVHKRSVFTLRRIKRPSGSSS
jgi:hypothetical protein